MKDSQCESCSHIDRHNCYKPIPAHSSRASPRCGWCRHMKLICSFQNRSLGSTHSLSVVQPAASTQPLVRQVRTARGRSPNRYRGVSPVISYSFSENASDPPEAPAPQSAAVFEEQGSPRSSLEVLKVERLPVPSELVVS